MTEGIPHPGLCQGGTGEQGGRGEQDNESEGFHQMRLRPGSSGRVRTPFQFHQPW